MSNSDDNNIFKIMDGIILQLNITKKLFIAMILSIMVIAPMMFLISAILFAPPFEQEERMERSGPPHAKFLPFRIVPVIISLVWLGIGIRQWFVLSKWTKKYEKYKELQEQIDKKLEDDDKGESEK